MHSLSLSRSLSDLIEVWTQVDAQLDLESQSQAVCVLCVRQQARLLEPMDMELNVRRILFTIKLCESLQRAREQW